jgi:predicted secreted protein
MGLFINDIEVTGGLKIEKVVTVPITVPFESLEDLQRVIEEAPSSVTATVKRATSSAETADVIITRSGFGVGAESITRLLDRSSIKYSVGRVKIRRADEAASSDEE